MDESIDMIRQACRWNYWWYLQACASDDFIQTVVSWNLHLVMDGKLGVHARSCMQVARIGLGVADRQAGQTQREDEAGRR